MMAGLFLIYLVSAVLIFWHRKYLVFVMVLLNLILCLLMLFHHSTDILNIRL